MPSCFACVLGFWASFWARPTASTGAGGRSDGGVQERQLGASLEPKAWAGPNVSGGPGPEPLRWDRTRHGSTTFFRDMDVRLFLRRHFYVFLKNMPRVSHDLKVWRLMLWASGRRSPRNPHRFGLHAGNASQESVRNWRPPDHGPQWTLAYH